MQTYQRKLVIGLFALLLACAAPLRAQAQSAAPFFDGGQFLGNDPGGNAVYYLPYFNTYTLEYFPYVYKYNFGYLYFLGNGGTSTDLYVYDFTAREILYTKPGLYPYFYDFNRSAFLYYFEGSNPRVFYNFGTQQFLFE